MSRSAFDAAVEITVAALGNASPAGMPYVDEDGAKKLADFFKVVHQACKEEYSARV